MKLTDYMKLETYKNESIHSSPLLYRVYVPKSKRKKNKLFIFLHGAGERGNDGLSHVNNNAKLLEYIIDHPIYGKETIIIAPQIPENERIVSLEDTLMGTYQYKTNTTTPIQLLLNDFIENEIEKQYKLDPQYFYIGGLSMGGVTTIDYITRYPNKFAAAISICGTLDLSEIQTLKRTPLWLFHSSDDPVVNYEKFDKAYHLLDQLGADVKYTLYNNTGHGVWNKAYEEPGLLDWLFSKKKTMPRY